MSARTGIPVVWDDGVRGEIEDLSLLENKDEAQVLLEDGRRVAVPASELIRQGDGSYSVRRTAAASDGAVAIPIIAEELEVGRQAVETGRVRISKRVHEREEVLDQLLLQEHVEVQRVPVNQRVDGAPPVRYEGDTMIVPIVEEVLRVEKVLVVKEELHITRTHTTEPSQQRVTLRSEEAIVERRDANGNFVAEPVTNETPAPAVAEPAALPEPDRMERPATRPLRRNKVIT